MSGRNESCVSSLCSFWIWLHKQVPVWEHWDAAEAGARRFSWNRDCILCTSLNSAFLFLPFRTDAVTSNISKRNCFCYLECQAQPRYANLLKDLYDNVVFHRCRRRLSYMMKWTSSSWATCQANPTYCKRTYLQMELEAERSVSIFGSTQLQISTRTLFCGIGNKLCELSTSSTSIRYILLHFDF
jgi:hypothetical protein